MVIEWGIISSIYVLMYIVFQKKNSNGLLVGSVVILFVYNGRCSFS